MIQDLLLRWIVTTLFVISATECVYGIAAGRRSWTGLVGNSLHALMAIAMAVMAWPRGADLPATGPLLFFLLAAAWFIALTLGRPGHRRANAYHAGMMLAMAWMYAVMNGGLLPASSDVASAGAHHGSVSMPGMNMPATVAAPVRHRYATGTHRAQLVLHDSVRRRRGVVVVVAVRAPGNRAVSFEPCAVRYRGAGDDGSGHGHHVRRDVVGLRPPTC